MIKFALPVLALLTLPGCDQLGQQLGLDEAARKEAESRAVGSACRHSGRSIEDCYAIYSWLPKAGIFAGWREMDSYMRENAIETVAPQLPPPEGPGKRRKEAPPPAETPAAPAPAAPAPAAAPPESAKPAAAH